MTENAFLRIKDLDLRFYTYEGVVEALDGIQMFIKDGETLGVVGETGCGKSVTGFSELNLIPPPGKIEGGKILLRQDDKWVNLLRQRDAYMRTVRGKDISMIFQDPKSALNPVYTVRQQISEAILHHRMEELCMKLLQNSKDATESLKQGNLSEKEKAKLAENVLSNRDKRMLERMIENPKGFIVRVASKVPVVNRFKRRFDREVKKEVVRMLKDMRIPDPDRVAEMYPHELSGGMAQRAVIAMALSCNPRLLIADEPTTNLDVTVQLQILTLMKDLKKKYGMTVQYITHDMGVVAEMCDRVAVMYAGNVVELAEVVEIFKNPLHPYTKALLECIPRPGTEFKSIEGFVPSLISPPAGCRFNDRCPYAMEQCVSVKPVFLNPKKDHFVLCHLYAGESQ
jgi:peptide/nickel transport system ATP-binding protein